MALEIWQEIPALSADEQCPIMSTLSDYLLRQEVCAGIGLSDADALFGSLFVTGRAFRGGRLVIANSLKPNFIDARVEARLAPHEDARWFQAGDFLLRLTEQQSQSCYGGWRPSAAVTVFGQ
jgi:hypothetical protein